MKRNRLNVIVYSCAILAGLSARDLPLLAMGMMWVVGYTSAFLYVDDLARKEGE